MTLQTLVTWYYGLKPVQTPTALPVQIPTEAEVFLTIKEFGVLKQTKMLTSQRKNSFNRIILYHFHSTNLYSVIITSY